MVSLILDYIAVSMNDVIRMIRPISGLSARGDTKVKSKLKTKRCIHSILLYVCIVMHLPHKLSQLN